ncbi:putative tail length tapemeasure protein [uncultured Caudovirales phage]|uniref:Putative tail length tapemeasure protein n=1 Tax=uncultured Caudovirales phage TaxID=2100421 RepID=A0A2H4JDT7_9CAUD|nr:putative tail length tapemeasure protein [uncultured Caudovirales phage]
MAERIKGLQIDLSMRDMGVSKTLSGIKREFRSLNSSLKLSSNNFKYGEKSASSYKTRMNDLDKSIKVGTSNLNELEKQYNQVAQSQGANSAKAVRLQTEYNKQANAINAMQDEYGRLNQYYRENFSMAGRLSNSFKSIGSSMQSVGGQAQNMGRSLTSSITKPALIAGTAMAGITAKLGFDRLVGLDSAKAKLEGLGYSTKEVGSITDQVSKAIEGGMTTMAEGTDVAAGALAAGVKEGKDLEKYIKLVGDAAVGSNRPVGEMAMIFNRVQGQGKLMTQELNMVEEGMPGFSNAMAKHLGVSYDAFREMVTNGEVSSKEFLTVMDDFAGGMANAYSKSWKGMMQNTKAYIGMIGESLLGGVFEQSKDSLHEFEKMLKSPGAQQWAKETGEKLGSAFSKLANGIKGIINWWKSLDGSTQKTLGGMVKWLGITLVTMGPVLTIFGKMASTIGGMFSGMSSLIQFFIRHNGAAKVSAASQAIWNGVTTTARGIANGYRAAMTALTTSQTIQAIKSRIAATAMTIWTGVTKAAALATRGLGLAIRFMTGPVGIVITVIAALTGAIVYLWKTNSTFRNAVISIWNSIKAAAISIFGFIKPYIINIWNAIKNSTIAIWNAIKRSAVTIWNAIKFAVQHPIQALKKVLSALWNGMKAAAIKIWTLLKNGVLAIIRAYVAQVRSNFNLVKRIVLTIFNAIKSFSIKVWNAIKNGILNIVRILRNGIDKIFKGIKNTVTTIFNAIKNFSIKVWNTIKNSVINRAKGLWNGVRNTFNALKKGTTAIFNAVKNFALKVWTSIKNSVVSRAKALWSGVRNTWNNLKKGTTNLFNSVGSFMSSKWNSIKSGTVNKAKALWSGVKGAWGSLSKGTRNTMNAVGSFMSKKWKDIKSGTVDIVTGMKDKITGVMNKMGDVIKSVTGDIKGFFSGMIDKVKGGLNKLIDGVNWVGGKLGMDKLPKIKLHTGTEHTNTTTNVVKNGKIARDTFATVGDKGRGNGPGGFRNEAIKYPNGKMALTPNRDTTAFLPKGSSVMNGAQTHSMLSGMPKFANGTLSKKKPKKNKKGDNVFGDAWDSTKAGAAKVVDGGKAVVSKSLEAAAKGKDWLKDKVGDVMDWIEKPGKLLNKVLEGFGVNMDAFGIAKAASLPRDMMSGMFGKLKKAATDTFKKWMEEQGAGDGGYIDLSKGINFGFANSAAEAAKAGYPFPRAHHGLDINYGYGSKLYSTLAGTATAKSGYNGGFGNSMWIKSGAMEAIYGHMSKLAFSGSKKVKPGTYLGLSGGDPSRQGASAGDSTGPHLHYEMRKNGVAFDPTNWLKKNNGGGSQNKSASKWKSDIKRAAKQMKVNLSGKELNGIVSQIQRESNGNAGVTQGNIGDINNLRGTPAQGLLQYVPSTFKSYAVKGHKNIKNGYDQLLAFFNNSNWRRDLPYGKSGWGPSGSRRFATGGLINSSGWYNIAEGGYPEFVIPTDPSRQSDAMKLLAIATQRIEGNKKNKRPNQMRTPSTSNTNDNEMMNVMARQLEATQRQVELLTQLVASNQRLEQKPTGVSEQDMSKAQGKRAQMMAYNMGGAF